MPQGGTNMSTLDGFVEQAKQFVQQTFPGAILLESRQVYKHQECQFAGPERAMQCG